LANEDDLKLKIKNLEARINSGEEAKKLKD